MALNATDAAAIVAIAKCNGVQVCIGHNHVFDPPMIEARKLIADRALGEILYAESWYGVNLGANLSARYMIPGGKTIGRCSCRVSFIKITFASALGFNRCDRFCAGS